MADEQHTQAASPFPLPPPFYNNFTRTNRTTLRQLQRDSPTQTTDALSLPSELRYLLPPPVPSEGKYKTFGTEIDHNAPTPTLADAGIEQLFPEPTASQPLNPHPHLLNLSRSLLTTFLSLTGALTQDPTQFEPATKEMQTLVYNMHDLINRYRPHQARETLIRGLEDRIAARREETRAIKEGAEKVRGLLQGMKEGAAGGHAAEMEAQEERVREDEAREMPISQKEKRLRRERAAWAKLQALDANWVEEETPEPDDEPMAEEPAKEEPKDEEATAEEPTKEEDADEKPAEKEATPPEDE